MSSHRTHLTAPGYASRNVTHFVDGLAWPAYQERTGRYVVQLRREWHSRLAVHDDMGELRLVPSVTLLGETGTPLCYFPQGTH